jgi:hypothetical protein
VTRSSEPRSLEKVAPQAGEDGIQKFSRINVYKTLVLPIILYGSEIWTLRKKG